MSIWSIRIRTRETFWNFWTWAVQATIVAWFTIPWISWFIKTSLTWAWFVCVWKHSIWTNLTIKTICWSITWTISTKIITRLTIEITVIIIILDARTWLSGFTHILAKIYSWIRTRSAVIRFYTATRFATLMTWHTRDLCGYFDETIWTRTRTIQF